LRSTIDIRSLRRAVLHWFGQHGRDLPWRRTRDPYAILVAEVMLQQTQVATVIPYYKEWLGRFPTLTALARASEADVLHAWQGLGYYRRARNLHACAQMLVRQYQGIFPRDIDLIRRLPGIGRYSANAVATFAFDCSLPVVEANISRLLARLYDSHAPIDSALGRELLWSRAAELIPARNAGRFNSAIMDLGATICVARKPKCEICPIHDLCRAPNPQYLPVKRARPQTVHLIESHALIVRRDKILLERCAGRWPGMWMLPRARRGFETGQAIHRSVFPFTHHRVTLRVFRGHSRVAGEEQQWVRKINLPSVALPSPHRRAINALLKSTPPAKNFTTECAPQRRSLAKAV
jgi:A/G-specific adenine glycosylase